MKVKCFKNVKCVNEGHYSIVTSYDKKFIKETTLSKLKKTDFIKGYEITFKMFPKQTCTVDFYNGVYNFSGDCIFSKFGNDYFRLHDLRSVKNFIKENILK